jgi:hypothetical protein
MNTRAEQVANAVLYEGYILYPYRPSSVKNQQRWNFGVLYPEGSSEGAATIETQCLVSVPPSGALTEEPQDAELDVQVRFLHLIARTVAELEEPVTELLPGAEPKLHLVQKIEIDGEIFQACQEGVEREIVLAKCPLADLLRCPLRREFAFSSSSTKQPVRDPAGRIAWLIVREHQEISGTVEVVAEPAGTGLIRLTIRIRNLTQNPSGNTRDGSLLRSLVSAHKILTVRGGEFISLIEPPESYREASEQCHNIGTFPVLAGEDGQHDVMLSSPIILYDYPQIAPESAGDLCDGTEIDEILSLRILTLTAEEKREMRQSDERGRRILERTETLPEEQRIKLHGVLRGLRPSLPPTTEVKQ